MQQLQSGIHGHLQPSPGIAFLALAIVKVCCALHSSLCLSAIFSGRVDCAACPSSAQIPDVVACIVQRSAGKHNESLGEFWDLIVYDHLHHKEGDVR